MNIKTSSVKKKIRRPAFIQIWRVGARQAWLAGLAGKWSVWSIRSVWSIWCRSIWL